MEENKSNKSLAAQIIIGTKEQVEASGKEYKPMIDMEQEPVPTEEEREELSNRLTDQIKEGAKDQKKADKIYKKMFGGDNYLKG